VSHFFERLELNAEEEEEELTMHRCGAGAAWAVRRLRALPSSGGLFSLEGHRELPLGNQLTMHRCGVGAAWMARRALSWSGGLSLSEGRGEWVLALVATSAVALQGLAPPHLFWSHHFRRFRRKNENVVHIRRFRRKNENVATRTSEAELDLRGLGAGARRDQRCRLARSSSSSLLFSA